MVAERCLHGKCIVQKTSQEQDNPWTLLSIPVPLLKKAQDETTQVAYASAIAPSSSPLLAWKVLKQLLHRDIMNQPLI